VPNPHIQGGIETQRDGSSAAHNKQQTKPSGRLLLRALDETVTTGSAGQMKRLATCTAALYAVPRCWCRIVTTSPDLQSGEWGPDTRPGHSAATTGSRSRRRPVPSGVMRATHWKAARNGSD
jgi:hypothetical protein